MAGQLIILPGVTAAASAGAPRISMNAPDSVAAKIASLKHVVSARALDALPGGGVSGRCRNTGAALTPKGTGTALLATTTLAGRKGLGLSVAGNAGLALPPGSLTNSFTLVIAVYLGAGDTSSNSLINLLAGFDAADTYISAPLRYYGQAYPTPITRADKFVSWGPNSTGVATAETLRLTTGWNIVVIDYNNENRMVSIAVNQAASFIAATKAEVTDFASTSYLEIGYHLSINRLVESKIGDLYTFSDSLLRMDLGKTQLAELIAALKTYYVIA
jgi:hypothetical protein